MKDRYRRRWVFRRSIFDDLYCYLHDKYGNIILIVYLPFFIYAFYKRHYLTIFNFNVFIFYFVIILSYLFPFVKKHYTRILCSSLIISIILSGFFYIQFKQTNYLYFTKSYVNCIVLKNKDYDLIDTSDYFIYQKKTPYFHYIFDNKVDYLLAKQDNLQDYLKIVEKLLGKIESYKIIDTNQYQLTLKNKKKKIIYIHYYLHFSILSFYGLDYHIK